MNWDKLQVICDVHYWITGFRVFDRSPCCEFDGVQTRSKPEIELWLGWMRKLLQDAQNLRNITGQRGGIVLYRGWKFSDGTWYEWFDYLKVLGQMFRWRVLKLAKCLLPTDAWMVITVKRGGFLPQLHHLLQNLCDFSVFSAGICTSPGIFNPQSIFRGSHRISSTYNIKCSSQINIQSHLHFFCSSISRYRQKYYG